MNEMKPTENLLFRGFIIVNKEYARKLFNLL